MKIIVMSAAGIGMKADSAMQKGGKPFFVPTYMGRFEGQAYVAVRISRLGKSIPSRFAHRYYDAIGLAVDFTAADELQRLRNEGAPWDMACSLDASAIVDTFLPMTQDERPCSALRLAYSGREMGVVAVDDKLINEIDEAVARLSVPFMLRQGDLIFLHAVGEAFEAVPGGHVTGYADDRTVLDFNVK